MRTLQTIDALRVMASLAVGLFHFSHAMGTPVPDGSIGYWLRWLFDYGYLGVAQFFMISGLVVPYSLHAKGYTIEKIGATLKKRFWRIEPPYWVSICIMLGMDIIARLTNNPEVAPWNWISFLLNLGHFNAIMGQPWLREVYWTLAIDWQFYLLCCVLVPWILHPMRVVRYGVAATLCAAAWLPVAPAWLLPHLLAFVTGIVLCWYFIGRQGWLETALGVAIMLYLEWLRLGPTHLIAVGLAVLVVVGWRWQHPTITYLSRISYSFYLTHLFAGWLVMLGLRAIWPDAVWVPLISAMAVSVWFAGVFYKYVESKL
jgi:peptidoglycan/LPS O-acetylase OafA/YrhL